MKPATLPLAVLALTATALACGSNRGAGEPPALRTGSLSFMRSALIAAEPPKGPPLDTSFLKLYAETRGFMLGRPTKPKITPDGKAVLFLRAEAKTPKMKLYEFDVATGKTKLLLSPEMLLKGGEENLTPEEKARRERQRISVGGFADYSLDKDGKRVLLKLSNRLYVFDRESGKVMELKTGTEGAIVDPKWSPDGKLIAYVRGYDVYVYDLAGAKESAVTTGGTQVKTHGLAEFVAQEEMGRHSGYWWSPDSKSIAYTEADHTGVEQWFIADPLKPDAPPTPQYYPRPGKKNVSVRLGVKPIAGGETVWVEWNKKKWGYLAAVVWQKYGPLTILVQNRIQDELQYRSVDLKTGKTVLREITYDYAFLDLMPNGLHYLKNGVDYLAVMPSGKFQTLSPVDEYAVLYGKLRKLFSLIMYASFDGLREVLACNPETGELVISRAGRLPAVQPNRPIPPTDALDPTRTVLERINLVKWADEEKGEPEALPICREAGVYTAIFSQDLSSYVATKTTLKSLPESTLYKERGQSLGTLPSVALEPPFKPNVTVEKVGDYWTAVVRPRDFDPKKKYPVVVDVYGGPKHIHVVQAMRNWLVPQWLADQGFIVVAIDNRGTPGRGRDWEKAIYQKFGTVPIEDQVKGLHALCDKFPEMDRDRVGIVGWSFGGYNAANAVLRRPDVFKAAVAGAPVTDWEDYDTHYTERYLGLLPESKAAYAEANLIPLAKDLKRPLLLVHGTADDNVYYRHTLKLADALFRAGKDFEMLPLPGITHMYSADPVVMERLWSKTAEFFKEHLK